MTNLGPQFEGTVPARVLRQEYLPSHHELYSENTGKAWFHEDHDENLGMAREAKLKDANRLYHEDERPGPDNQTLVDHIRSRGFIQPALLDSRWKRVIDGNHHIEAAHS